LPLIVALALPALADDAEPTPPPTVQERFEALLDQLMDRLEPSFDALGEMMGDLRGWHAPEFLPNGDIIIRRRTQPPTPEDDPPVTDPFEL
jgi:hypothetical protein